MERTFDMLRYALIFILTLMILVSTYFTGDLWIVLLGILIIGSMAFIRNLVLRNRLSLVWFQRAEKIVRRLVEFLIVLVFVGIGYALFFR